MVATHLVAADGKQSQATNSTATPLPWASSVPTETLASFASRGANIPRTEERATTLQQMLALGSLVEIVLSVYELIDSSQYSATCGQRILWAMANMYHICDHFVSPPLETLLCMNRRFCEAALIAAP